MPSPRNQPLHPPVRIAPLGELNAYAVYEHELDALAKGSPGSNLLNFASALLSFAGALLIALLTTKIEPVTLFAAFFSAFLVTLLVGGICLWFGITTYQSNQRLVATIKNRMPPQGTPASPPAPSPPPPPSGPTQP